MKADNKTKGRTKYLVDRHGFWAQCCIILMLLSAVFRIVGCWGLWDDSYFAATQIALPLCCNILFALCVFLFGKKGFWLSAFPVLLGVVFFTIKAFGFESWLHTILCILLYLVIAVVYTGTVFGVIGTKWLLPPLFGCPLLYHILVEDLAAMQDAANPVTLSAGMQEMSVLLIMAALFCVSIAMKKKKPELEDSDLPKIKDPVVIPPEKKPEEAEPACAAAAPIAPECVTTECAPADSAPALPDSQSAESAAETQPDDNATGDT